MIGDRAHVSQWWCAHEEGSQVLLGDFREKQRLWHVELRLASPFLADLLPQHLNHTDHTVYLCPPPEQWALPLGIHRLPLVSFCLHKSSSWPSLCIMSWMHLRI